MVTVRFSVRQSCDVKRSYNGGGALKRTFTAFCGLQIMIISHLNLLG